MIEAQHVRKTYSAPGGPIAVLSDVCLSLASGDAAAVMGPSGSGKSTLLFILGTLDQPSGGTVRLAGEDPFGLTERELARFRNRTIGFMFQDHCLLPQCSVLENVLAPTLVAPADADAPARARALIDRVGLGHRIDHRPAALSGGEKQRVSLARALVNRPQILLCDEPTGNLDHRAAEGVAALLAEVYREHKASLVVVTHSEDLAGRMPRRFELVDGRLESRA